MAESTELVVKTEATLEIYNKLVRDAHRMLSVDGGTKTISSGAISIDPGGDGFGAYIIAAESGTSDELDTINGAADGDVIVLEADAGDTITLVHGSGNIYLRNGANLNIDASAYTLVMLRYDGSSWSLISGASTGGAGAGDVTGPASSTDNAIARFNGTGGKDIQNSAVTVADTTGAISINGHQAITDPTASPSGKHLRDDGSWAEVDVTGTELGTGLADADLILVHSAAWGRATALLSRVWTYILAKIKGESSTSGWGIVVDEDNMASNLDTKVPTQQSVKAYVDAAGGSWDGDIADINLDGGTDIGADLADGDLMLVDDGAGGTNRKSAISRVWTYILAKIKGESSTSGWGIVVDEDNMASNLDTKVPTQQSVKAYVDAAGGSWDGDIADIDLDGGTDIGAALADGDLMLVDDGAGGTNRKSAISRIKTYVQDIKIDDFTAGDDNTDLNASTSKHGLLLKATAPAANELNVVGIGNGETAYANKDLFNTTNPAALGSVSSGTAVQASRSDHVHANPKIDDLATPDDNTDLNASTTAHGLLLKATAPAAGLMNVVGIENGGTVYANKALFDASVPGNTTSVQSAATGSAMVAARRDHVHGISHSIADNAVVTVDDAGAADDEFARFTAHGIEGLTVAQALAALFAAALPEALALIMDAALSADGTYCALEAEDGTAGTALAFGDLCYLAAADSRWEKTDADASATAGPVKVGFCILAAAGDGSATRIMFRGKIRADSKFPTLTISAPAYISTTTGEIQVGAPTGSGDIVRIIGHGRTADELYVDISPDWIELA